MNYEIRVEQSSAQPLAVIRRRCGHDEFSRVIPEACGVVWNAVKAQNIAGAGRLVAVYLDCVFHLEISVEVASSLPMAMPIEGNEELFPSAIQTGRVATTTHMGP